MPATATNAERFLEFDFGELTDLLERNQPVSGRTAAVRTISFDPGSSQFSFTRELFLRLKSLPNKGPEGPNPEDADL